jgi:pimeloyl-ACP methyl ester carboxylesterase
VKIDLTKTDVGGFNFEFLRLISSQSVGAAEIGECIDTIARIGKDDFNSWITEWIRTATRVAATGHQQLEGGDAVAARTAFLRAANYFRAAEFYATHDDPRQEDAWQRSRECFATAAPLLPYPPEPIEIAFGEARLPGYFIAGVGEGPRPTLVAISGFDGSGEEVYYWIGPAAAERGWNCLIFEGPGQRGALHLNPGLVLRPDYEAPVGAVLDDALARPEVDPHRIALLGYSLGGFLATRAAAFEPRIRAVIANSLVVDVGGAFAALWPAVLRSKFPAVVDGAFNVFSRLRPDTRWGMDHARWAMGVQHAHDFFAAWAPYTLWGTEDRLATPLLCMVGEDEIAQTSPTMITDTLRYLVAVRGPAELTYFPRDTGASSHCQMGGLCYGQAAILEWLERVLPPDGQPEHPNAFRVPDGVAAAVLRHHPRIKTTDLAALSRQALEQPNPKG